MQTATYMPGKLSGSVPQMGFTAHRPYESLSDEQLVQKSCAGERDAFDTLIRRYERPIYHLAYRLAGNNDDAHDIAAEAFLRIYRSLGTFRCAITLPAWINRIVANVFFDMRRRQQRHPATSLDALAEKTGGNVLAAESTSRTSPEKHAEENEKARILRRAIAALPDYQRAMVTLFHSEGRTYEEIASMMRVPVGTVKSRLNRARQALRAMLTPQMAALMS